MTQLVLFQGLDANNQHGLWMTDGTAAGTKELPVSGGMLVGYYNHQYYRKYGLFPDAFTPYGDKVLFRGLDAQSLYGLWVTDSTAAGTTELQVAGASRRDYGLDPLYFTSYGGKVLFNGKDAGEYRGLWITDGTAAGTTELQVAGTSSPYGLSPTYFTPYGGKVLFAGNGASGYRGLWATDGTAAGTAELQVAGARR